MQISDGDRAVLQELEEALWRTETRFDNTFMEAVLASDFIEFGRSGRVYNRAECLSQQSSDIHSVLPLNNLHIRLLTATTAQVTYVSEITYNGVVEKGRRSSIWTKNDGQWRIRFHQGTPFT